MLLLTCRDEWKTRKSKKQKPRESEKSGFGFPPDPRRIRDWPAREAEEQESVGLSLWQEWCRCASLWACEAPWHQAVQSQMW